MSAVAHVTEDVVRMSLSAGFSALAVELPCSAEPVDSAERVRAALLKRIGAERFDLWFDRKTHLTLADGRLVVETVNDFAANWIRGKFTEDLRSVAAMVVSGPLEIVVRVGENIGEARPETPAWTAAQAARAPGTSAAAPRAYAPVSPINPKYTLEEFVVGPSNQMAYHAAARVAQLPGQEFNPLFLHGHCGLGKTHLLQGICQRFARLHPGKKWLYITGEQFTNEFLEAIRAHKTDAFRRRIRGADLLVIDDVHFLANKKATQEEFLHTFNQVDGVGRQIVLASDCPPRQIQNLSEQLSTRFVSGMVVRVDAPDLPTRLEILRRRAARNGWNLSETVLIHLARSPVSSVRELEGLLLQAVASMNLIHSGHAGAAEAGALLANLRQSTAMRGPVPVERIVAAVADHFAQPPEAILGKSREKPVGDGAGDHHVSRPAAHADEFPRNRPGPRRQKPLHRDRRLLRRVEAQLTKGDLICWITPEGPRNKAVADVVHDLEGAIRRAR